MKIVIAYLYYDLLNLYGETGNLKSLKLHLKSQDIEPVIEYVSTEDKLDFKKYDLVIMSAGTEQNQMLALDHLLSYKKEIKEYIENNKFFLVTGNAVDLFGKYILDLDGNKIKCLGIFDYYVTRTESRIVNDALFRRIDTKDYFLGFQNQSSIMKDNKNAFFEVVVGNNTNNKDGIHYKNFYGTYLIGPLLARNPEFTEKFIKELVLRVYPNFKFEPFDFKLEREAFDKFMSIHYSKYKE